MNRLIVTNEVVESVFRHAEVERPNECCGFLAGHIRVDVGYIVESIPIVNELQSSVAYRTEARSLFKAYFTLRDRKYELIGVYHSHPNQSAIPSRRDREEWTYGETVCAIVGIAEGRPEFRAWQLQGNDQKELEIKITDRQSIESLLS
jgi:proteasome lid subunit RPN8/RPN11